MPNPPNITQIPAPRVELIDPRTGLMSREWYRFFINLFALTGNGSSSVSITDLLVGPPPFDIPSQSNVDQLQPSVDLSEINNQIQSIAVQSSYYEAIYDELIKRLQDIQLQPSLPQLGTIASYNLDGTPTLGGVGYGTGSAIAISAAGSTGQILTSAGAAAPTWSGLPTGTILQVVNATFNTDSNTNSTTYIDSGLTVSITPSSATSKILVQAHLSGIYNTAQGDYLFVQLVRDAVTIGEFAGASGYTAAGGASAGGTASITYLDSPATTSAVVYKVQVKVSGSTSHWSNNNSYSTITAMEVA